jgi:serine/threonine-protein kinase
MEGRKLSHFRVESKLGEGGMGLVYKAKDETLRRPVALKVLPPSLVGDADRRQRFLREAQAAAAVSHPSIAAIYEVGEDGSDVFIAMEYVEGRTLRTLLEEGPLKVETAVALGREIALGLDRAHASGVIHRDLKPENVMVGPEGHAKILDFGLAKLQEHPFGAGELSGLDTRSEITRGGTVVGTVGYMSPEQARGKAVDNRSDLFSLGILLYELVTGRNPFKRETMADTLTALLAESPPPASGFNPGVPSWLDGLLARLLEKEAGARPRAAAEVAGELAGLQDAPPAGRAAQGSIAVLPFADMSPQKDQDYFCEGIAEELTNALSRVEGLRVAARTSTFQFKGRADDVRRIGQRLGVATVLEGSVRKAGDRLRITVQCVSASDGYQLWSERYDRQMEDIFAVQDEIASKVVEALKIRVTSPHPVRHATEDVEAYHLYLKGRYWWNKRYKGGLKTSTGFFEQAIEKDPGYALAHAGLADACSVVGFYGFQPPREVFPRAKAAAERAVALDEGLPEAHVSRALVHYWFDRDWAAAEREFQRAIELAPNHVAARIFLGQMWSAFGRVEEARPLFARALELDPLGPLTHGIVGSGFNFARLYEEAVEACSRAIELDPNHVQAMFAASIALSRLKREEAISVGRRVVEIAGRSPLFVGVLGSALATLGHEAEARELLSELEARSRTEYVGALFRAWIHGNLQDRAQTLDLLEQAYEEHETQLFALKAFEVYDFLRGEPRFEALVRSLALPEPPKALSRGS